MWISILPNSFIRRNCSVINAIATFLQSLSTLLAKCCNCVVFILLVNARQFMRPLSDYCGTIGLSVFVSWSIIALNRSSYVVALTQKQLAAVFYLFPSHVWGLIAVESLFSTVYDFVFRLDSILSVTSQYEMTLYHAVCLDFWCKRRFWELQSETVSPNFVIIGVFL